MYEGGNLVGERNLGNKHYELTNHLGNVLAVVTDNINMADDLTTATVASATDYYPFGLEMAGRTFSAEDYRYGFNGKEKDQNGEFGSTHYDYGFRIYNPEIGKFLSVDPLTFSYPWYTPYQFAGNKPIWAIDLDGLEERPMTLAKLDNRLRAEGVLVDELDIHRLNYERRKLAFRLYDLKLVETKDAGGWAKTEVAFNSRQALDKYYASKDYDLTLAKNAANEMINKYQEIFYNFREANAERDRRYSEGQASLKETLEKIRYQKFLESQEITIGDWGNAILNTGTTIVGIASASSGIGIASAAISGDQAQASLRILWDKAHNQFDPNKIYTIGGYFSDKATGDTYWYSIVATGVSLTAGGEGVLKLYSSSNKLLDGADAVLNTVSAAQGTNTIIKETIF